MVATLQHVGEDVARIMVPAGACQRINQPEGTGCEGCLRLAEIVRRPITVKVVAEAQMLLDRLQRREKTRIAGGNDADLRKKQQAGIEFGAAEGRGEVSEFAVPGA